MFLRPQTELLVRIVTPEADAVELKACEVFVPGADGVFTVLPNHTTLLSTLRPGVLVVNDLKHKEHFYAVSEGFVEVNRNHVVILTDTLEHSKEVDLKRAEAARERAEKRLTAPGQDIDAMRTEAALYRAIARISAHKNERYYVS